MKCVLHIGTEKTGSTLLQDWLYQNQVNLSRQRIFLSDVLSINNNRRLVSFFQWELDDWTNRNGILTQKDKDLYFTTFLNDFAEEINAASDAHDLCIISSEHFHSRLRNYQEIEPLQKYLETVFDSVEIVCYFREQSQMARSLYSTALKGPYTTTLERFVHGVNPDNYYYNHKLIADNWSRAFGKENTNFRIYDRKRFVDQDIRRDLLACLPVKVNTKELDFSTVTSNESLSRLEGELYRVTNKIVPFWKEGNEEVNSLNVQIKNRISSIDSLKQGDIVNSRKAVDPVLFKQANQEFFDAYFNGEYLFSTENDGIDGEESDPVFTLEQLTEIIGDLFQSIIKDGLSGDADWLRDLALKYETQEELTLDEAAKIMTLAGKARPTGPFIRQKLVEYNEKLAS